MQAKINTTFIVILLILVLLLAAIGQVYRSAIDRDFIILHGQRSTVVELANGKYFEIDSRNDVIFDGKEFFVRPFGEGTQIDWRREGLDWMAFYSKQTEVVKTLKSDRLLTLQKQNGQFRLDLNVSNSGYTDSSYYWQFDYSGTFNFNETEDEIKLSDDKCLTVINKNPDTKYEIVANNRSLRMSKKAESKISFNFEVKITCD